MTAEEITGDHYLHWATTAENCCFNDKAKPSMIRLEMMELMVFGETSKRGGKRRETAISGPDT
jgi:hypothetical protein